VLLKSSNKPTGGACLLFNLDSKLHISAALRFPPDPTCTQDQPCDHHLLFWTKTTLRVTLQPRTLSSGLNPSRPPSPANSSSSTPPVGRQYNRSVGARLAWALTPTHSAVYPASYYDLRRQAEAPNSIVTEAPPSCRRLVSQGNPPQATSRLRCYQPGEKGVRQDPVKGPRGGQGPPWSSSRQRQEPCIASAISPAACTMKERRSRGEHHSVTWDNATNTSQLCKQCFVCCCNIKGKQGG
jgi:hypothetical protein